MRVNEMILSTENGRGKETNFLSTFEDYKQLLVSQVLETKSEVADAIMDLGMSLNNSGHWSEVFLSSGHSMIVRYCKDEDQLRSFLSGYLNSTDQEWSFDEERSSTACLETLRAIGIQTNGRGSGILYHYKNVKRSIYPGEILRNFNGYDYRVLERLSENNLLLMNERSGDFVVAIGVSFYVRFPKGEVASIDNMLYGIEWGHGIYYSQTPSTIDFKEIREKYGTPKKMESLKDFRCELMERYCFYRKIIYSPLVSQEVREAASNSMYNEFQTGIDEVFQKNLVEGMYDRGFLDRQPAKKAKVR